MVLLQSSSLVHSCACRKKIQRLVVLFCFVFFTWVLSPQTFHVLSSAGNRASEGGDGEVGEGFVQGGHADGVWGPVLPLLVQPLLRAELQEPPRAHHGPTGGDHRGGRHRDTSGIVGALSQGRRGPLRYSRTRDVVRASLSGARQHWMLFKSFFFLMQGLQKNKTRPRTPTVITAISWVNGAECLESFVNILTRLKHVDHF